MNNIIQLAKALPMAWFGIAVVLNTLSAMYQLEEVRNTEGLQKKVSYFVAATNILAAGLLLGYIIFVS